jgi:holo-[acyl-carrier protein] synthase
MIFGIGTDIIEVQRVGAVVAKGPAFTDRIFTPLEVEYCESKRHKSQHYAARFAAKEAFMKALGTGWSKGIGFNQIEVTHLESRQPEIILHGKALEFVEEMEIVRIHLTLTHIKEYAIATVILEL